MKDWLYKNLELNGFVIIDLLTSEDVIYINQLCDNYLQTNQSDFVSSSSFLNKMDSDFINDELHKIIRQKFELEFPYLQLLGGTLATKTKGKSNLKAHQDWTIVDESKYNSYNLWVPLIDTNSENGTLGVIVGSHKWNNYLRGFNIPNPYEKFTDQLLDIGYEPSIKAGQAVLYNHKLVHYSKPNKTIRNRNTAIIGVKDKSAILRISFTCDGENIDTYTMSEEGFYRFDIDKIKSEHQYISTVSLRIHSETWENISELFRTNLPKEFLYLTPQRKSVFSKLLNKIKF